MLWCYNKYKVISKSLKSCIYCQISYYAILSTGQSLSEQFLISQEPVDVLPVYSC